jgi:hypothetical protein
MSENDLKAALEAAVPGLEVYDIEQPYPVQIRGTIGGHRFSFYAKGNFLDVTGAWELSISDTTGPWTPQMLRIWSMAGWCHEEKYENNERDAGDMSEADMIACIAKAVSTWRARHIDAARKACMDAYEKKLDALAKAEQMSGPNGDGTTEEWEAADVAEWTAEFGVRHAEGRCVERFERRHREQGKLAFSVFVASDVYTCNACAFA